MRDVCVHGTKRCTEAFVAEGTDPAHWLRGLIGVSSHRKLKMSPATSDRSLLSW